MAGSILLFYLISFCCNRIHKIPDRAAANSNPGTISAVSALEKIYDKYGYDVLDRVLKLIIITWEGESKSFSANMLNGVARLVITYGSKLKEDIFKEKLCEISIKEISKTAKDRRAGSLGYAEAMLIYYNKKMRSGLQWNELYQNKATKDIFQEPEDIPCEGA